MGNKDAKAEKEVLQIDFSAHIMVVTRLHKIIRNKNIIIALSNIIWAVIVAFLIIN